MRSILSFGMVLRSTPRRSISFNRRPFSKNNVLDDAVDPKPRRSTTVVAPLFPPVVLQVWMPALRDNPHAIVVPGEREISSAVITLLDAPTMPVPVRDAQTSIGGKNVVESCAPAAARTRKAKAAIAPHFRIDPMRQRSFVCAPRLARTHR